MSRRRFRRGQQTPELDITAFMNLMVVLVPFLLMTAVFNQLVILELNLPPGEAAEDQAPKKKRLELELVVRTESIDVRDRNTGRIALIAKGEPGYDFDALTERLVQLKRRYTDIKEVSILLEQEIPYDTLIAVMDRVRAFHRERNGADTELELFPEISIGDAPVQEGQGQ